MDCPAPANHIHGSMNSQSTVIMSSLPCLARGQERPQDKRGTGAVYHRHRRRLSDKPHVADTVREVCHAAQVDRAATSPAGTGMRGRLVSVRVSPRRPL